MPELFAEILQANIVHASDSPANAQIEIKRFFDHEELFQYERQDKTWVYSEDEIA